VRQRGTETRGAESEKETETEEEADREGGKKSQYTCLSSY
jgi:hypothetical protein